jgi:ankyrin repeat protein
VNASNQSRGVNVAAARYSVVVHSRQTTSLRGMHRAVITVFLLQQAVSAATDSDLIKMASTGNDFTPVFQESVAPLRDGRINSVRDPEGRTILHWAAIRSHQARALVLLLAGADVNAKDNRGRTPLFDVVEARDPYWKGSGDFMMLEMLALRGSDVNARADDGTTPLAIAVEKGDYRKAEFLIWRGATIEPVGVPAEKLPMNIAFAKNDARMTSMLKVALKLNAPISQNVEPKKPGAIRVRRLSEAMTAADLNAVEDAIDSGWNINEQDEKGQTALFRAIASCRADLANFLIFEGADPNIATKEGETPLMVSMRFIGIEGQRMAAILLLKGADPNATSKKGETPLTAAAATGYDFGVQWLISAGADPLASTPKGSVADYCTHGPTLAVLNHFGVSQTRSKPPETAPVMLLCEAARRGDLAALKRELENGAPVDGEDNTGNTALGWAANYNQFDTVDFLLRHGANINKQNAKTGWHILISLAEWGGTQGDAKVAAGYIEKLLARGANPNIQMKNGTTPLMAAAKEGVSGPNSEALLKGGANLNLRNKEGLTALGIARKYGRNEMIAFLQARGAVE